MGASPASAADADRRVLGLLAHQPGRHRGHRPASSTSTSLAPWADTAGPARRLHAHLERVDRRGRHPQLQPDVQHRARRTAARPPAARCTTTSRSTARTCPPSARPSAPPAVPRSPATPSPGRSRSPRRRAEHRAPQGLLRHPVVPDPGGLQRPVQRHGRLNPATTPLTPTSPRSFTAIGPFGHDHRDHQPDGDHHARKTDVISFSVSSFSGAGTGTASLCDSGGANCDAGHLQVTIAGDGTGTGTLAVGAAPSHRRADPEGGQRWRHLADHHHHPGQPDHRHQRDRWWRGHLGWSPVPTGTRTGHSRGLDSSPTRPTPARRCPADRTLPPRTPGHAESDRKRQR